MWHTILFLQYFKKPTEDNRSVSAASERFVLISSGYRGWKGERRLCSTFPFITFLGSCLPFAPNLFHFYRLQRFCVDQKRKKTQPKNLPTKQEASWMTVTSLILQLETMLAGFQQLDVCTSSLQSLVSLLKRKKNRSQKGNKLGIPFAFHSVVDRLQDNRDPAFFQSHRR